jgi:hypothetical protein
MILKCMLVFVLSFQGSLESKYPIHICNHLSNKIELQFFCQKDIKVGAKKIEKNSMKRSYIMEWFLNRSNKRLLRSKFQLTFKF